MNPIPRAAAAIRGCCVVLAVLSGCASEPGVEPAADLSPGAEQPESTEPAAPMAIDEFERRWTALLAGHVDREGRVDYAALAEHAAELAKLVEAVGVERTIDDRGERLAWLLNAYNLIVVNAIVEHRPKDTVRDIKGVFDKTKRRVLGRSVTLDELRDTMIRPLGDPRSHAAICNGAMGSGVLASEAFTAAKLDDQLTDRAVRFVNSRGRNAAVNGVLLLNPVFRWFAGDFAADPHAGPVGFVRLYAEPDGPIDLLLRLTQPNDPPIEFLEFNWAINARR